MGLDSSTQSLSVVVIDYDSGEVVYNEGLNFSENLPHYGTENGVLKDEDPTVVHSCPLMWAEALDQLFQKMKSENFPFADILTISGSGQQHGSVYLNSAAPRVLENLDANYSLVDNLTGIFSRETAPVWMDSSTSEECEEISAALGGMQAVAELTGSTTFERFTGPQIRKFYKQNPDGYQQTAHIALVSSFMASILAGQIAPIDHGDGAGMNLMDISAKNWSSAALDATAPGLRKKLPPLVPSDTLIGTISPYYVKKYGFRPETEIQAWSGDNPNSLIGLGLVKAGMAAISCGTSDTYFGFMRQCHTDPRGEGHVFGAPTGDFMTLICFKNGSLARERVKDAYGLDWAGFAAALRATPPGNNGKMMLPYFEPEIVPKVLKPGVRRRNLDENDTEGNCRAVVEAQMMSMRIHSEWMGERPVKIYATGGGSKDVEILQIMADVNNCPTIRFEVSNSAALGAALRAAHGHLAKKGTAPDWETLVEPYLKPDPNRTADPDPSAVAVYNELIPQYAEFEKTAL